MELKDFKYKGEETFYIGRNGMGKQIGLGVSLTPERIELQPINSKNNIANCMINIPYEDVMTVVEKLKEAFEEMSLIHPKR